MTRDVKSVRMAVFCDAHTLHTSYAPVVDLVQFMNTSVRSWRQDEGVILPSAELTRIADRNAPPPENMAEVEFVELSTHRGRYDIIFLPALAGRRGSWPSIARVTNVCRWIKREHSEGSIIGAVGSGVIQAAASGVLDHEAASIRLENDHRFSRRFPHIKIAPVPVFSSGGVHTARDVSSSVHLVEQLARTVVNEGLAANFLRYSGYEPMPDIRNDLLGAPAVADPIITDAKHWMLARYREEIRVDTIAAAMGVTSRTFARRFKSVTGTTPLDFLQAVRVDVAKAILRRSDMPIDEIAQAVGYRDVSFFRKIFRLKTGMSPTRYRRDFIPACID